jgi:hypothetical protein
MFGKIIAGTAVAGLLAFGVVGMAGASTPAASGTSNPPAKCAKLPALQARVQKVESRISARLPKAEAREAQLKSAGKTQQADAIANRITKLQNRESKVNARLAKAQAACAATTSNN